MLLVHQLKIALIFGRSQTTLCVVYAQLLEALCIVRGADEGSGFLGRGPVGPRQLGALAWMQNSGAIRD